MRRPLIAERNLTHVKVGAFDIDGILRGKYISRAKFESALEGGFGFCDVVLGWDSKDQLYDNARYTGWHTGYPDANVRILPRAVVRCRGKSPVCSFSASSRARRSRSARAPRCVACSIARSAWATRRTRASSTSSSSSRKRRTPIREKGFRDLKPIAPDYFGYSVIRNSVWSEYYRSLLDLGEKMDFPIEGLHEETGPGVIEAAIGVDSALVRSRQGGALQDLRQGARPASGPDGDVHGEVVEGLAGAERPHPPVAERRRRASRCFTMRRSPSR